MAAQREREEERQSWTKIIEKKKKIVEILKIAPKISRTWLATARWRIKNSHAGHEIRRAR